jgi:hypothetical protein
MPAKPWWRFAEVDRLRGGVGGIIPTETSSGPVGCARGNPDGTSPCLWPRAGLHHLVGRNVDTASPLGPI